MARLSPDVTEGIDEAVAAALDGQDIDALMGVSPVQSAPAAVRREITPADDVILQRLFPDPKALAIAHDPNTTIGQMVATLDQTELLAILEELDQMPEDQPVLHPALREFRMYLKMAQVALDGRVQPLRDAQVNPVALKGMNAGLAQNMLVELREMLPGIQAAVDAGEIDASELAIAQQNLLEFEGRMIDLRVQTTAAFDQREHLGEAVMDHATAKRLMVTLG